MSDEDFEQSLGFREIMRWTMIDMQDYLLLLTSLTRPTHASVAGTACSVEERSTAAYHLPRTKETKSELQTI